MKYDFTIIFTSLILYYLLFYGFCFINNPKIKYFTINNTNLMFKQYAYPKAIILQAVYIKLRFTLTKEV